MSDERETAKGDRNGTHTGNRKTTAARFGSGGGRGRLTQRQHPPVLRSERQRKRALPGGDGAGELGFAFEFILISSPVGSMVHVVHSLMKSMI